MDVNGVASSVGSETSPSEAIPTAIGSVFVHTRLEKQEKAVPP